MATKYAMVARAIKRSLAAAPPRSALGSPLNAAPIGHSLAGLPIHPSGSMPRRNLTTDEYAKLPQSFRDRIERTQMTPQRPDACLQHTANHLARIARDSEDPQQSLASRMFNRVANFGHDANSKPLVAQSWARQNRAFAYRGLIASPQSNYAGQDHSVAVLGSLPAWNGSTEKHAVIQDGDASQHPTTLEVIQNAAAKFGVPAHELSPGQINSVKGGGPHLMTRVVPMSHITDTSYISDTIRPHVPEEDGGAHRPFDSTDMLSAEQRYRSPKILGSNRS